MPCYHHQDAVAVADGGGGGVHEGRDGGVPAPQLRGYRHERRPGQGGEGEHEIVIQREDQNEVFIGCREKGENDVIVGKKVRMSSL